MAATQGCSSFEQDMDRIDTSVVIPPAVAGVTGYTVYEATGENVWAAGGAAAGAWTISEFIRGQVKRGFAQEFNKAYIDGRRSCGRDLLNINRNIEKAIEERGKAPATRTRHYTFPGAATGPDGTRYVEHGVTVRMEE
jgi:hypothetical protein